MNRLLSRAMLVGLLSVAAVAPAQEQSEVAVTVYTQDLGLVREIRTLELDRGIVQSRFTNVAARLDPTSVHLRSLTAPDQLTILEQNYEFDLISADKLLARYLDRPVEVILSREIEPLQGTLLSFSSATNPGTPGGDLTLARPDGSIQIIQRAQIQSLRLPSLPERLITRPTLIWTLNNQGGRQHRVEVSYLTSGLSWHAEYIAVVRPDQGRLGLSGWVSINNRSGATYPNARLKLVAGDVHRAEERRRPLRRTFKAAAVAEAQFEERAFFEYHLYSLERRSTIGDNQIKQLALFPETQVKAQRVYTYEGQRYRDKVKVSFEFANSKAAGLGMPLPKGKIRVYQADQDGSQELVGEDRIDHTPRDEVVRVVAGNVFDLVGERKIMEIRRLGDRSREETIAIRLRNHKSEAVTIRVIEHLYGDWEIRRATHDYQKKEATTLIFNIPVKSDGEAAIQYTALYRW